MIKTRVAFWRAGFSANQGFLKTFQIDCFDCLDKSRPSKNATFDLIM